MTRSLSSRQKGHRIEKAIAGAEEELAPVRIWTSPSGRTLVDFGQNLVGRIRFSLPDAPSGTEITVRPHISEADYLQLEYSVSLSSFTGEPILSGVGRVADVRAGDFDGDGDQDFVVAFETEEPKDFLDLVMELRETQSSKFTQRDTPIFTCVQAPIENVLDQLF